MKTRLKKSGSQDFNTVIQPVILDLCLFLNGSADANNLVIKWFFDIFASLPKGLLHACPYNGVLEVYNLTAIQLSKDQFYPGQYMGVTRWFDEIDDNVFTSLYLVEAISGRSGTPKRRG